MYYIAWSARKGNYGTRCRNGKAAAEAVSVRKFSFNFLY
jgi:hypothetical protein